MKAILAAVTMALTVTGAHAAGTAQTAQPAESPVKPSVLVDVSNVAGKLADALSIDVGKVPPGVDVPVETAAEVCDETADMLAYAAQGGQEVGCEAKRISDDLTRALKEQIEIRKDSGG